MLHVYHHATISFIWWMITYTAPGGDAYFSAALNSFVVRPAPPSPCAGLSPTNGCHAPPLAARLDVHLLPDGHPVGEGPQGVWGEDHSIPVRARCDGA